MSFQFLACQLTCVFFFTSHSMCQLLNCACQLTCILFLCEYLHVKNAKLAKTLSNNTLVRSSHEHPPSISLTSTNKCKNFVKQYIGSKLTQAPTLNFFDFNQQVRQMGPKWLHWPLVGVNSLWGPLHTRDWEPVTITLQPLSLVDKAEPVQVRFTLRLRDQQSMWMQDGCKVHMDSYMASNGSRFMITWTILKNHLLEVGLTQNRETMAFQMLTTINLFYHIICEDPHE